MNEFMLNPTRIDRPRSVFPLKFRAPTTMIVGEITPLMVKEVLPGDTWTFDLSSVITAFSPFVSRVYGDLFLDVYAFFVPNRLVWEHWQQFCGENDTGAWTQTRQYTIPQGHFDSADSVGSIGDHMGLPVNVGSDVYVNELPLRGYYRIYNEWFRNENTDSPIPITYGDSAQSDFSYEATPLTACRFADYFSEGLPGPQKGGAVSIPLVGNAPVVVGEHGIASQSTTSVSYPLPDLLSIALDFNQAARRAAIFAMAMAVDARLPSTSEPLEPFESGEPDEEAEEPA